MTTPHRATPEQWVELEHYLRVIDNPILASCLLELRDRVAALEDDATCPYVVSSDEGTSYCQLAEQGSSSAGSAGSPTPVGELMQSVGAAICTIADCGDTPANWAPEARGAILAVAAWVMGQLRAEVIPLRPTTKEPA